ncbi:MAG TPA: PQQ-binding-like beta-propeller repeat protein [Puia sp.]|nr:PQQ-binding-like beta-propeller repeat protein [Puia sp.]
MSAKLFILFFFCGYLLSCHPRDKGSSTWKLYRGNAQSNAYSALDQINAANVQQLRIAWEYHTRDSGISIQCNPIIVNGVMYVTSPALKLIALKAGSGEMLWTFDPFKGEKADGVNRGVAYWEDGSDQRILFSAGYKLYAVDARSGQVISNFGQSGTVDLREGLDRRPDEITVDATSPGIIFGDLLIMGSRVSEGEGAAPGYVRAYNVRSGKEAWVFHTIPRPGEYGYDGWEKDAWKNIGGANTWSGLSLDEDRGMVFFATGSCSPDFYGGDRKGQNLFANSVIALNAKDGKRIWHYQIIHHDLWDYDPPMPPNLVTLHQNGRRIDAVMEATKTGNIFVFDRETGKSLFEIKEQKVPQSDIKGEQSWPTQPFPVKPAPFVRQKYTDADISDISPEANAYIKDRLKNVRNEGIFTPSSDQGSIVFPGFRGGAEWNGGSFDIETGIIYINANEIPNISSLKKVDLTAGKGSGKSFFQVSCATCHGIDRMGQANFPSLVNIDKKMNQLQIMEQIRKGKGLMPAFSNLTDVQISAISAYLMDPGKEKEVKQTRQATQDPADIKYSYAHSGYGQFLDQEGYPAVKPPWGTLNAIDLNTGELLWKVPLGEYAALTKRGIPPTGTQNFGGTIVTAGGLIFVGASKDEKFRAFDKRTGKILWETRLPAGGYATPCTYEIAGKQYVVIAAGGGGKNDTKKGDSYVAFALP